MTESVRSMERSSSVNVQKNIPAKYVTVRMYNALRLSIINIKA